MKKKIVIVEDQLVLASIYRAKFASEGFEVEVASDGQSGLDLINRTKPDLVLLDLILPKIKGVEVLKQIRSNPLFQKLPVIIFSGSSQPDMVEEAWKAGVTMVLSKTSHGPKQIVESVRKALAAAGETEPVAATSALNASTSISALPSIRNGTGGHILLARL